jgi:hypothetical protein
MLGFSFLIKYKMHFARRHREYRRKHDIKGKPVENPKSNILF